MKLKNNIAEIREYTPGKTIKGAIKLSSNENPLGPSPKAVKAIMENLNNINRYPEGSSPGLRKKLAEIWKVEDDQIVVGNGSDEVFLLLTEAWLEKTQNAVSALETFSEYKFSAQLQGAEFKQVPLKDGRYNLEGILEAVDENTAMVFLCNPNNPTGTYFSHTELEDFLTELSEKEKRTGSEIITVLDEAYAEFAEEEDFPDSKKLIRKFPNLVVSRTFSKLYGLAGLRVGYAAGSREIIKGARKASAPFNVNLPAQIAAEAALDDAEFVAESIETVITEKNYLYGELDSLGLEYYKTQSNFICINLKYDSQKAWEYIAGRGISVRSLKSFMLPEMIRYTIGRHQENELFINILSDFTAEKTI